MKIELKNIMPEPLREIEHGASSIWGNDTELRPGNLILLNASSGKRKSTFSNTIYGVRLDYAGTILFDGRDIKQLSSDEWEQLRQTKISAVFQDLQLFHHLTVAENLRLKNELTHHKTDEQMMAMLERLGIGFKWDSPCGLLSMGQQQRVAIVRALCQPFEWLILDEPFSHLDEQNSRIALDMIAEEARAQNAGFVLTSLDPDTRFAYDYELML